MKKIFHVVLFLTILLTSVSIIAQDNPPTEEPPNPEMLRAEDAARRAEAAANDADRSKEVAQSATDLAFNLLGLFEAFGLILTVGAAAFTGFGFNQLRQARNLVKAELEESRQRFEAEVSQRRQELDDVRQSLEEAAEARRDATQKALLAQAYIPLGERQYRAQDYLGSISTYKRALELDPNNPVIHYRLGYVYTQTGDLDQAKHHYMTAMDLAEDFAPAMAGLGFVHRRIAEKMDEGLERDQLFNEAEKLLLQAMKLAPKLVDDDGESWWGILGGLYRRRGQIDQAIYAYKQATIVTPQSSYGFGNLAFLYLQKSNREEMLKTYAEVEKLAAAEAAADVDNYWGHADLVVARYALGKEEEAKPILERALQISPPDSPYVLQSLVDTLEDLAGLLREEKIPALHRATERIEAFRSAPPVRETGKIEAVTANAPGDAGD